MPALIRHLADEDPLTRGGTAQALGAIGSAAEPAIPRLNKALSDEDRWVRSEARAAIQKIQAARSVPAGP